ncbi:MAG: response regulator transcription factor [Bdellovibrionales bacterium]|nr:response regulator transcription factor [Bdellovibrionales bacterium]
MRALIIDDDADLLELYTMYLEEANFSVVPCEEGLDGFLSSIGEQYDLIISDLNMPIISGQELILEIRDGVNSRTPIIVVSGFVNEEVRAELKKLGHIYFVEKPIERQQLLAAINETLKKEADS